MAQSTGVTRHRYGSQPQRLPPPTVAGGRLAAPQQRVRRCPKFSLVRTPDRNTGTVRAPQRSELGLEGGDAPALFGDELAIEDQREELPRGDATLAVAQWKERPAVDLPAVPAWPRHEAREDRQQPHGRRAGVAVLAPAPIGPGGHAEGLGYLCGGEARALLQRAQRGQIDRKAFGQELGIRALEAATARARVILTRLSVCQRKLQMSSAAQGRNVRSGPGEVGLQRGRETRYCGPDAASVCFPIGFVRSVVAHGRRARSRTAVTVGSAMRLHQDGWRSC